MEDEDSARKAGAVKRMIEMLKSGEAAQAQVAVIQYFIEGGIVSRKRINCIGRLHTNLEETKEGFRYHAFFRPECSRHMHRQSGNGSVVNVKSESMKVMRCRNPIIERAIFIFAI